MTTPHVPVPANTDMAEEPAMTIGDIFANKTLIQPMIAAAVALVSGITGYVAEDDLVSNITTLIAGLAILWTAVSAQMTAANRAREQARVTREAVYAPQTVADIVDDAAAR